MRTLGKAKVKFLHSRKNMTFLSSKLFRGSFTLAVTIKLDNCLSQDLQAPLVGKMSLMMNKVVFFFLAASLSLLSDYTMNGNIRLSLLD